MAKWFKEFPINLKNGTDRIRSASESGSQPRANKGGLVASIGTKTTGSKTGHRKNSSADSTGGGGGGGGVGSLLSGRNRKNSAIELNRNGVTSPKDGKVWDTLLSGKSRKNSKAEPVFEEQQRPPKSSPSANAYINRLIRVDKQDKSPNFNSGTISSQVVPEAEKPAQCKTETSVFLSLFLFLSTPRPYTHTFLALNTKLWSDMRPLPSSSPLSGSVFPFFPPPTLPLPHPSLSLD